MRRPALARDAAMHVDCRNMPPADSDFAAAAADPPVTCPARPTFLLAKGIADRVAALVALVL
ncbi:MAG TPA: hypothetical protein VLM89_10830, partial [Phycisphaerae bacterium]|nr:hypothetical protein [Phycisphaerae bacterium]